MKGRMDWLRLHSEARTDAKLRSLTCQQFRVWFNLLCFASEQPERGTIDCGDHDLLAVEVADGDRELLDATLARLEKLRIVGSDAEHVWFLHWERRQYDKPSDAPAETSRRQAKHRGAVTPSLEVSHDVTPRHATEEEGDEEVEGEGDRDLVPLESKQPSHTQETTGRSAPASAPERELLDVMHGLRGWRQDVTFELKKLREWPKVYPDIDLRELCSQMDTWQHSPGKGARASGSLKRLEAWASIAQQKVNHGDARRGNGTDHQAARSQVRTEDDVAATDAKWAAYAELRSVR